VATTNHPELIDAALTSRPSRFDRVWVIDNPGYEARKLFVLDLINDLVAFPPKVSRLYLIEV
jgi:SpoVK/Ycf46/Vps4 family AAA+-type ATPase